MAQYMRQRRQATSYHHTNESEMIPPSRTARFSIYGHVPLQENVQARKTKQRLASLACMHTIYVCIHIHVLTHVYTYLHVCMFTRVLCTYICAFLRPIQACTDITSPAWSSRSLTCASLAFGRHQGRGGRRALFVCTYQQDSLCISRK